VSAPATAQLAALYQEIILDHYRRPRNKGDLPTATGSAAIKNPVCGDEIEVFVEVNESGVREVRFKGRGCSISQSSASMMTELVRGKSALEAQAIAVRFGAMLRGDADAARDESLGETRALSGVARFPARHRCATLAWSALVAAMKG
jgi:nitrogen fixation protein NifU and related proteins